MELSFYPAMLYLGQCPKNPYLPIKEPMHPNVHSSINYSSQVLAVSVPIINKWNKKLWYFYPKEYYPAERKKELLAFVTAWMELESIMLSEISQVVRDKYHMISPLKGT